MTVQSSASRFHWLEKPLMLPAKCMVCGAVDRPVIDFNFSMDYYGVIYFCESCIGEAARVIGFISPADGVTERLGTEQSVNRYLKSNDLVAIPRDFFELVSSSIAGLSDALAGSVLYVPVDDDEQVPDDVTGAAETDNGTSGQSSKPSRKRRSNVVSSDSGDEFDFPI